MGWIVETVEGVDAETCTRVAVDGSGLPHAVYTAGYWDIWYASYTDGTGVKYAYRDSDGTWHTSTLSSDVTANVPSIAIRDGVIHVAWTEHTYSYTDPIHAGNLNGVQATIKHAYKDVDAGSWTTETIATLAAPSAVCANNNASAGWIPTSTDVTIDSGGSAHIVVSVCRYWPARYSDNQDGQGDAKLIYYNGGSGWAATEFGAYSHALAKAANSTILVYVNGWPGGHKLACDSGDTLHYAWTTYYDYPTDGTNPAGHGHTAYYADSSSWTPEQVAALGDNNSYTWYCTPGLDVDADDKPHVVFHSLTAALPLSAHHYHYVKDGSWSGEEVTTTGTTTYYQCAVAALASEIHLARQASLWKLRHEALIGGAWCSEVLGSNYGWAAVDALAGPDGSLHIVWCGNSGDVVWAYLGGRKRVWWT